jgi:hypothetical protein
MPTTGRRSPEMSRARCRNPRFISALLRVRVLAVLGRIATAVHPASSAVGNIDVVRTEPLLPPVIMIVAPAGVGRGD